MESRDEVWESWANKFFTATTLQPCIRATIEQFGETAVLTPGLFPLDGSRRLGTDVVHNSVDTFNFVDDIV